MDRSFCLITGLTKAFGENLVPARARTRPPGGEGDRAHGGRTAGKVERS